MGGGDSFRELERRMPVRRARLSDLIDGGDPLLRFSYSGWYEVGGMFMSGSERSEWRRSSFCADGMCVEVRDGGDEVIVRNRKRPDTQLHLPRAAWREFVEGVVRHEFG